MTITLAPAGSFVPDANKSDLPVSILDHCFNGYIPGRINAPASSVPLIGREAGVTKYYLKESRIAWKAHQSHLHEEVLVSRAKFVWMTCFYTATAMSPQPGQSVQNCAPSYTEDIDTGLLLALLVGYGPNKELRIKLAPKPTQANVTYSCRWAERISYWSAIAEQLGYWPQAALIVALKEQLDFIGFSYGVDFTAHYDQALGTFAHAAKVSHNFTESWQATHCDTGTAWNITPRTNSDWVRFHRRAFTWLAARYLAKSHDCYKLQLFHMGRPFLNFLADIGMGATDPSNCLFSYLNPTMLFDNFNLLNEH